jgi:acyl-CoA oxidase
MPGVTIKDMGWKMGSNGLDNAIFKFDNVKIPLENMMDRLSDINDKGEFVSTISNINSRVIKATEKLLSGRVCIASMSLGASKVCLYIALKFSQ